ncbi:MAG: flagellin [Campylobacteraceae bacterium]|nr:flagellin [Campylobacteraceae bacterium]
MGFRINTNVAALNAHNSAVMNNKSLSNSLSRLSSGLRINKAADDASGMAIADSLRSQANSLGQAISNANDGINLVQTADGAMDAQLKILDTIKTKAIQAASDGQTTASRGAIQKDVNRLLEQLDNIAKTTSFNGQVLLSGKFSNKEFQVGAFSNQTIKTSINNTQSLAIGSIATTTDLNQFGNIGNLAATASVGSTTISVAETGLAKGDTIKIAGQTGTFTITGVNGTSGAATITLNSALTKQITAGAVIAVDTNATNATAGVGVIATTAAIAGTGTTVLTVAANDFQGLAIGDTINIAYSSGGAFNVVTVTDIDEANSQITVNNAGTAFTVSSGVLTTSSNATVNTSAVMGSAFSGADYVQYNVEGTSLIGVQMTDSSGNGVADTGLGRVADLINETTDTTGIKATATVSETGSSSVAGGILTSDITINGVTILNAGDTLLAGDTDNKLKNAIESAKDATGVSASLTTEGKLQLTTDGRVMTLTGMTSTANITDGTYAGDLNITKNNVQIIDITAAHYSDAALSTAQTNAGRFDNIVESHTLSDLVTGQKDSNGDGVVNSNDAVGLLNTREGAMLAMNIVESAISDLDSTRADLGSVQNQLSVTVNNISVTQVNVKAAESGIRDVDFAAESANFSKFNILAQSGSYAMSQANAVQQNVLRLLQ